MRILLCSASYPPRVGGLETVTHRLATELTACGHDLTVLTNRYPRHLAAQQVIDDVPVHRFPFPDILPRPVRRSLAVGVKQAAAAPPALLAFGRVLDFVSRLRPDVINVHYFSYPAVYVLAAARPLRVPVVLSLHGSDLPGVPYADAYAWTFRAAAGGAAAFTTCSAHLGAALLDLLPSADSRPVVVAYSGVDAGEGAAASWVGSGRIVIISRLVEKKGVDVAIRALALLRSRGVGASLDVVGDGPLRSQLERVAGSLVRNGVVRFTGSRPPHEAARRLREASFCVVPSRWEAFGVVALEAMAAGKAVVASRTGGLPEIVRHGETGILVEPGDAASLAGAMQRLLERPDLARAMGARGQTRVFRHFRWDRTVERYLEAYRFAVGNRR